MNLRKLAACTLGLATMIAAAGCAEGTGQALSPTLPTAEPCVECGRHETQGIRAAADVATIAIRVSNLTPQLVLRERQTTAGLSYVFEVLDASSSQVLAKSDPIPAGSPQTTWDVPANVLKMNATYAWRGYAVFSNVQGSNSNVALFSTPMPATSGPQYRRWSNWSGSMRG